VFVLRQSKEIRHSMKDRSDSEACYLRKSFTITRRVEGGISSRRLASQEYSEGKKSQFIEFHISSRRKTPSLQTRKRGTESGAGPKKIPRGEKKKDGEAVEN